MRSRHLVVSFVLSLTLLIPTQISADSWDTMTPATANDLYAIWGIRDNYIFAAGESGTIIRHTDDSTLAWTAMTSGIPDNLFSLWGTYGTLGYNNALIYLFAGGANNILLNTTGGTWTKIDTGAFTMRSIWGSSEADVYAVGDTGVVLHSTNAYNTSSAPTWTTVNIGAAFHLLSIWGTSASNIYVGGEAGTLYRFDGTAWSPLVSNTAQNITAIWGFIGYRHLCSGYIRTGDSFQQWYDMGCRIPGWCRLFQRGLGKFGDGCLCCWKYWQNLSSYWIYSHGQLG